MRKTNFINKLENHYFSQNFEKIKGDPKKTYKHLFDDCPLKHKIELSKHENVVVGFESNCGHCKKRFEENEYPKTSN